MPKRMVEKDYNKYKSIIKTTKDKDSFETSQQKVNEDKIKKKRQQKKLELLSEFQLSEE